MAPKEKNTMAVKILKGFSNPMTNRMLTPDVVMNVPKNQFWFRRCNEKDCQVTKEKITLAKPAQVLKSSGKDSKKGASK